MVAPFVKFRAVRLLYSAVKTVAYITISFESCSLLHASLNETQLPMTSAAGTTLFATYVKELSL